MTSKRRSAYEGLLNAVKSVIAPRLNPSSVMTDYEQALQILGHTFPTAEIRGCWFHFAQSIWLNVQRLGLAVDARTVPQISCVVKMCMVLPLLPAHLTANGLRAIETEAAAFNVLDRLQALFNYISNYWLRVVTPARLSVFGQHRRTNNNTEAFNKTLGKRLGHHPNFWTFVSRLREIQQSNNMDYHRLLQGQQVTRARRQKYVLQDKRIIGASQELMDGVITITQFY